jgi:serine/threonine-protein kinase RsbT
MFAPAEVSRAVVPIERDADIVVARQAGRSLATTLGFSGSDLTVIATAISEVARNIVVYAGRGELIVDEISEGRQRGILIVARDDGPGIADLDRALEDGFSTSGSLGLGLPGAKRLMNELVVESVVGRGTTVTMKKWLRL